jgi:hypothetical protein
MRKNTVPAIGALTAVLTLLIAAPTAQTRTHGNCYLKGSSTIAQDAIGRFFMGPAPSASSSGAWYYCAFKHGPPHVLAEIPIPQNPDESFPMNSTAVVAGRFLAFLYGGGNGPTYVEVYDMVAGRLTFDSDAYAGGSSGYPSSPVPQLVLKHNGSVAWIASLTTSSGVIRDVHRHDSTGTAIPDQGSAIDPRSLAAGGSWLYWTNAGAPRSGPFH